ncbi:MAG: hypothetical protein IJU72_04315 [Bacteroidales bacterium]|nr:hypothetical protein [Bacteroidales bacterium]
MRPAVTLPQCPTPWGVYAAYRVPYTTYRIPWVGTHGCIPTPLWGYVQPTLPDMPPQRGDRQQAGVSTPA